MARELPTPEQVFRRIPCFCGVLLLAARVVNRIYNEELRHVGLEATQYSMLSILKQLPGLTIGDLGERLAVDKTTISRNVKVLERNGWVATDRAEDGRQRILTLTRAGGDKLASARTHWERAQNRMAAALPAGQFDSMRRELPEVALAALGA